MLSATMLPLLLACAPRSGGDGVEDSGALGEAGAATQARYTFTWDLDGVVTDGDGPGWVVETDLGYTVALERGYLTSYHVYLDPCDEGEAARALPRAGWGLLGTAHAGHGLTEDPSMLPASVIEDLAAPSAPSYLSVPFEATRYCGISYLAARADGLSQGMPDDVDMTYTTLYLEGQYTAPGDAAGPVPFTWSTALSNGLYGELEFTGAGEVAHVTIARPLAALFDGIRLDEQSDNVITDAALRNIVTHTTFHTTLEP